MTFDFLQRLLNKNLLVEEYKGSLITSYQVRGQDLFVAYNRYHKDFFFGKYVNPKGGEIKSYLSPEKFIEEIKNPSLKKELLFNLNLFR